MRELRMAKMALAMAALGSSAALAQVQAAGKDATVPRFDVSVGFDYIRANAPPAICNCFGLDGGYISGGMHITDWLSLEGEFTGTHASDISVLGQDLTLMTYTVGPKVTYRHHRLMPYGEFLVGGAHGGDSYFPSSLASAASATSFAFSTGGGLDVDLTRHFAIRAFDAQYLKTSLPNGADNAQNQLMLSAGLVIKFRGRTAKAVAPRPMAVAPAPVAAPVPPSLAFTCGTNVANVTLGQMVQIFGDAKTEPETLDVTYEWSSDGGLIEGTGRSVAINTTGMAIGDYRVKGHAALAGSPATVADCTTVFRVVAVEVPPAPSTTYITLADTNAKNDRLFHENVKDAFFDYNSAAIRPDTHASIEKAARYLTANPSIHAIISGWTDPRGSAQYNLALGIRRANAVRDALVKAGVSRDQLEVISNGKSSQVCTTADKACFQGNRRVSFSMKP